MTQRNRLFKNSILAIAVATVSGQTLAAGFQLNAQSATGVGRAFAGDAVIADNASVMARNPAAMALFDKSQLSLGFETIVTDIQIKDSSYGLFNKSSDYGDAGGTSVAPNAHFIMPINDKFAVGINAYSNFGTKTEFGDGFAATPHGGLTDVKSMNLGLAGSYRMNEQWSFGAGIDLIYGEGTMKRELKVLEHKVSLIDVDGADGFAVGFNVGTVFELDENNRFGLSYRYSPKMETKDDKGQKITLPLPDIAEFSGYHRIKDTKFAAHYSVQYIGWGAFDKIEFSNLQDSLITRPYDKHYDWQDGWHYSIGGTYYLNDSWTLRAGYMYDTSAQNELTSVSVPDSDRQWLSSGFTYHLSENSDIDFGFTYLVGKDVAVEEGNALIGKISATTRADALLFGLQYSHSF
ncbi:Long-chain fatty acid transport protein [Vibrio chagasii]|nr:Long-chain fatty acid transport protein [Vibrio chagasii]